MPVSNEKTTTVVGGGDSPNPSTLSTHEVDNIGNSNTTHPEKLVQSLSDDQYPHGLVLVFLAGASLIAVFLIALDQVSIISTHSNFFKNTSDIEAV